MASRRLAPQMAVDGPPSRTSAVRPTASEIVHGALEHPANFPFLGLEFRENPIPSCIVETLAACAALTTPIWYERGKRDGGGRRAKQGWRIPRRSRRISLKSGGAGRRTKQPLRIGPGWLHVHDLQKSLARPGPPNEPDLPDAVREREGFSVERRAAIRYCAVLAVRPSPTSTPRGSVLAGAIRPCGPGGARAC